MKKINYKADVRALRAQLDLNGYTCGDIKICIYKPRFDVIVIEEADGFVAYCEREDFFTNGSDCALYTDFNGHTFELIDLEVKTIK